jgi:hypothetical protein
MYIHVYTCTCTYIYIYTYMHVHVAHNRFFSARLPSKNKTVREGTVNKERQEGKCDRPGHCGIENSSWEGRENRGPGGREGDAGTDRNIDEGGEDKRWREREKNIGEGGKR